MDVEQTSPPLPSKYLTSPPLRKCNWDIFGIFAVILMIFRVRNQTPVVRLTQRVICCIKIKIFKSSSFGKHSNHILSLFKTLLNQCPGLLVNFTIFSSNFGLLYLPPEATFEPS